MEKKRSVGVTVFGIIFLVLALLGIPNILAILSRGRWLYGSIIVLYITFLMASSMGLFMLKEWGRKLSLFFGTFWIIRTAFCALRDTYNPKLYPLNKRMSFSDSFIGGLISLIIVGILIFYYGGTSLVLT